MSVESGGPSDIQIYKHGGGYRVRPATFPAGRGTHVRFFNAGPDAVRLIFPDEIFAGVGVGPVDIGAGSTQQLTVKTDVGLGAYPYAVYVMSVARDFARGDSAPVIIIDR